MFVDASAMVAILAQESDYRALASRIEADNIILSSPMSCWETVSALRRSYKFDIEHARAEVERARHLMAIRIVPIGDRELEAALDAYQRYGKGRHSAQLNMGDCFAYACATTNDARLLYKGSDFAKTDLA